MLNAALPSKDEILLELLSLQERLPPLMLAAQAHTAAGRLDQALALHEQMIAAQTRMLQLGELNNQRYPDLPFDLPLTVRMLVKSMQMAGDILEALGQPDRGEAQRAAARQLAEQYLDAADAAESERQHAAALVAQGRFNEALVAYTAARAIFEQRRQPLELATVAANIADIYEWFGDYGRALDEVERAARLIAAFPTTGMPAGADQAAQAVAALAADSLRGVDGNVLSTWQALDRDVTLLNIRLALAQTQARANRYLGHAAAAERQFRALLPQVPAVSRPAIEAQLAALALDRRAPAEALAILERLEPAFQQGLLRMKWGALLSYKGQALLQLGRPAEALAVLETAVSAISQARDLEALWKAQQRRAEALLALQRPEDALAIYAQAVAVINNLRKAPLGYRLDSTYLQDKLPVFAAAIHLACNLGQAELCCRFIELIKARTLTAVLARPAGAPSPTLSEPEQQLDALTSQLEAVEYAAFQNGWTPAAQQQTAALLSPRAARLEQLRFSDPRWRALSEPAPFDLPQVSALLAARGQAALQLFFRPPHVVAVLLQNGRCTVAKLTLTGPAQQALERYQANLQAVHPTPEWFDPAAGLGLAAEDLLPPALLAAALQARALVVIPHGALHLLPWAALTYQGRRLFEYCPVGVLPNLSCLPQMAVEFAAAPKVALLGAPDYQGRGLPALPLAAVELQTIEMSYLMYGGLVGPACSGKQATQAAFWQLARQAEAAGNILHVSSHAAFEAAEPLSSGLLLTDGRVDAAELARGGLRYAEAVLSACSTGYRPTSVQGVALTGDDILGLPGALLEAGVRSVLVSIPPAREDASQRFMTLYHEARAAGAPPLAAYQGAQQAMLQEGAFAPHLWAGMTLYGCG
jgi:CHAT domain-containing protein